MLTDDLIASYHRLRAGDGVEAVLTLASGQARELCGFDRAVILEVADGRLRAQHGPLADPGSEALRGRLELLPSSAHPGTAEGELLSGLSRHEAAAFPSLLATRMELGAHVLAPVAPDDVVVAVLLLDRARPAVGPEDDRAVDGFAAVLAAALELAILRRRAQTLAAELRQFASLARALAHDIVDAPVALPSDYGLGTALPRAGARSTRLPELSAQERRVAELLIEGRSNRDIAATLVVSAETVKTHVTRIRRKLGAASRAEAVSLLLRLPPA